MPIGFVGRLAVRIKRHLLGRLNHLGFSDFLQFIDWWENDPRVDEVMRQIERELADEP